MNSNKNNALTPGVYFFSFIPSLTVRMQIQHIMQRLPSDQSLKLQTLANLHQTVLFLGELNLQQITALDQQTEALRCLPIGMQFDHVSYWAAPKIFCLTSRSHSPELLNLANKLEVIAKTAGIKVDDKPYQPHITLARKASNNVLIPIAPVRFKVDALVLMKSVSTEDGPDYQPMMSWPAA